MAQTISSSTIFDDSKDPPQEITADHKYLNKMKEHLSLLRHSVGRNLVLSTELKAYIGHCKEFQS